jgi:YbgC/YbaW family acyl-CoA thioester hydrolase
MYSHSTPHRVRLSEVDHFEVLYFGNYLKLFEKGLIEMYRSAGMGWKWFEDNDVKFLVASAGCDYRKPVRLEDMLEIRATTERAGNASLTYRFDIYRTQRSGMHPEDGVSDAANAAGGNDGAGAADGVGTVHELVAVGKMVHVFIGPDGRPDRLPDSIRSRFDL